MRLLVCALVLWGCGSVICADEPKAGPPAQQGIVGKWDVVKGSKPSLEIDDKLEVNTPFGRHQLKWIPPEKEVPGRYVVQVERDAGCNTTSIWRVGYSIVPLTNYSDNSYYDEVFYSVDPDGYLHVEILDRSEQSRCRISTKSEHIVYARNAQDQQERETKRIKEEIKLREKIEAELVQERLKQEEQRRLEAEAKRVNELKKQNEETLDKALQSNDLNEVIAALRLTPISESAVLTRLTKILSKELSTSEAVTTHLIEHIMSGSQPHQKQALAYYVLQADEPMYQYVERVSPKVFEPLQSPSTLLTEASRFGRNLYGSGQDQKQKDKAKLAIQRLAAFMATVPLKEDKSDFDKAVLPIGITTFRSGELTPIEIAAYDPLFPAEVLEAAIKRMPPGIRDAVNPDYGVLLSDLAAVGTNLMKEACQPGPRRSGQMSQSDFDSVYANSYRKFQSLLTDPTKPRTGVLYRSTSTPTCSFPSYIGSLVSVEIYSLTENKSYSPYKFPRPSSFVRL